MFARYVATLLVGPYFSVSRLHHVVDRLKLVGVVLHFPGRELLHVVAGFGLRLGRLGQDVLVAHRGDEIGLHGDIVLALPNASHCFFIASLPAGTQ